MTPIFRAIGIGVLTSVLVMVPRWIWASFSGVAWSSPLMMGIGVALVLALAVGFDLRRYNGLADFILHIHLPPGNFGAFRWILHSIISFILCLMGGAVGPEGAAMEFSQGTILAKRSASARWFDHLRRTDIACILTAGLSAAFGTPLAAVIAAVELRLGGHVLAPMVSSIVAYLVVSLFERFSGIAGLDLVSLLAGVHFSDLLHFKFLLVSLSTILVTNIVGGLYGWFIRGSRLSFSSLFGRKGWLGFLFGAGFICAVVFAFPMGHLPSELLLEKVLVGNPPVLEVSLLLLSQFLFLSLALSVFGTVGFFWPIVSMGGMIGYLVAQSAGDFSVIASLLGVAVLWSSTLGLPIAGSVLVWEFTNNPLILGLALAGTSFSTLLLRAVRLKTTTDQDLKSRGLNLERGRAVSILEDLGVGEAMVTDHESVREHETVDQLYSCLHRSLYPFLPVVSSTGSYIGMLTADVVEEAWREQDDTEPESKFSKFLEAKDLVYRAGMRVRALHVDDKLSSAGNGFDDTPVVPVLGDGRRVVGLLFAHSVRIAYDQEVARRSLFFRSDEKSRQ